MTTSQGPESRLRADSGQTTGMVAILTVAILVLAGLVVDGGAILSTRREATAIAGGAARAGTQALDEAALRSGTARLDTQDAVSEAYAYLEQHDVDGSVTADEQSVHVEVRISVQPVLLTLTGAGSREVTGRSEARIERGR